jgi:hypothetical protein
MTEQETKTETPRGGQQEAGEVLKELQTLGQQLVTAVRALWESEDSRKLRQEIGQGFVELGQQIDEALTSAQQSEAAKQFGVQVKDTIDKARESDLAAKLEQGLVTGLQELNDQISKFVDSLEPDEPAAHEPQEKADV